MKAVRIIGISVLALVWIWLCSQVIAAGGVTLRSLLLVAISGIIIFVPLWKKYFKSPEK